MSVDTVQVEAPDEKALFDDFAASVEKRAKIMSTHVENLLHGAIGASGEAGELLDSLKKSWVYNKPIDDGNIVEECGDILWYVQHVLNHLGVTMEDCMIANMQKLAKRYPDGYSDAAAVARADKQGEGNGT